jgi:flagellar FliL protein
MAVATKKVEADKAEEPAKGKSKMKLIIIVVLVLAMAGGGYEFMAGGSKKATAEPKPEPGLVVPLDAQTLNLDGGHFLKLKVAIVAVKGADVKAFDASKAADAQISEFSNRSMADISTEKGREARKAELLKALQKEYPKLIYGLLYTQFVMQ